MTISGWRFKPRLWSTLGAAVVITIMVQLGNWQLSRAQQKEARQERLDLLSQEPAVVLPPTEVKLEDFQYRQVEARGEYVPGHTIYLDNKIYRGVAGYHIITPLRIGTSSMHVLVNRGWAPADRDRSKLPEAVPPSGQVSVSGIATTATQKTLELSQDLVSGRVWKIWISTAIGTRPGLPAARNDFAKGRRARMAWFGWPRPDSGSAKNLGYAVQWFAMALAVLIIYLVLSGKRERFEKK